MSGEAIRYHQALKARFKPIGRGPICFFCSNAEGKWNREEPWECAVGYQRMRYKDCIHFDPRTEAMEGLREYFPEIWSRYAEFTNKDGSK